MNIYNLTTIHTILTGIRPESLSGSQTGFFLGSFSDDTDLTYKPLFDFVSTRLSHTFNFKGPTIRVDTACASSLSALNLAILSIMSGECSQAIVAGTCIHQKPILPPAFIDLEFLSKTGHSWVLDARADGFVRSEAIVAVLVQRHSVAQRVYLNILSCVSNTDGYTNEGLTFPNKDAQILVMKEAIEKARVDPADIKYIEAHLTGTQAGDNAECTSISQSFRPKSDQPIMLGALKANIGHTEGAAGLCAITKVAKIFQNQLIPANIQPGQVNTNIEPLMSGRIDTIKNSIPFSDKLVGINAFGYGGANCHLIVSADRSDHRESSVSRSKRMVLLCNRTRSGLVKMFDKINSNSDYLMCLPLLDKISGIRPRSATIFRAYIA